jgi:hypothetical protein
MHTLYLQSRDPEFEKKMAQVLCVYRDVAILKKRHAAQRSQAR